MKKKQMQRGTNQKLGYPISAFYLGFISKKPPRATHIYFFITGFILLLWNYGNSFIFHIYELGLSVVHLFIGVYSTLATLHIFGPTNLSVALTFVFNMTYLLVGYYYMNYGTYDINWTMSYCILCLRLIGIAWDFRDGSLPIENLSEYQKNAAIKRLPDPLEIASFCFMPTSCFAGPQFTWRHYQSFVNRTLRPKIVLQNRSSLQKHLLNPKLHRTLSRLSSGFICLAINIISQTYFPMEYMTTKKFLTEHSFFYRLGYMGCYSKCLIFRYLAIWLIGGSMFTKKKNANSAGEGLNTPVSNKEEEAMPLELFLLHNINKYPFGLKKAKLMNMEEEGACVLLGLGCTGRVRIEYTEKKEEAKVEEEDVKKKRNNNNGKEEVNAANTLRKVAVLSSNAGAGFRLESELCPEDFQALQEGRATLVEEQHIRCANVSIVRYELATNTDLLVSSFNINTNKWMLE
ncbi:unnamed protein product [Rodentolepis nana]|uniref:Lysophospholipid acyltransferase 5 n=1 Tax=Rodentolepis nana TaxID=102285 RepID=A0A0R3TZ61_RODNA|nr:unnamed protein product [Rodentolepis nana]